MCLTVIGRGSPEAVTRCKVGVFSLVNVPSSCDKVVWCISDTADPESNIISMSTPPIFPVTIELDLTVATVMILLSQVGLTDCGDACYPVQVPRFCLTENTVVLNGPFCHNESSEVMVGDEYIGAKDVQLDYK